MHFLVAHRGIEPRTPWLKVTCSTIWANEPYYIVWQGWQDLNLRNAGIKIQCLTAWLHPYIVFMGRVMRIEPTTSRTTILRSNQLSYTRHMVRLKGFEPLTLGLEGRCSLQLSYRFIWPKAFLIGAGDGNRTHAASLEGWNSTIELHPHIL